MGHLIATQTIVVASPKPKKKGDRQQPPRVVTKGTYVDDKDVIVKGREDLFLTPDEVAETAVDVVHHAQPAEEVVEQATAAPGEKRATKKDKS